MLLHVLRSPRGRGSSVIKHHLGMLGIREAGKSNQAFEGDAALRFAIATDRCVLTINRKDFMRPLRALPEHRGIIVCTENRPYAALAGHIQEVICATDELTGQLIRVVRGNPQ